MAAMHTESSGPRASSGAGLERAIVLQLLSDGGDRRSSRVELGADLETDADTLEAALRALNEEGVLYLGDRDVWASRAARRLDELELISL
jgi:hypothetical protein